MGRKLFDPMLARLAVLSAMLTPERFRRDQGAFANLGFALSIVGVVIGAVVAMILIAALLPTYLDATASVVENLSDGSVGDETADTLLPLFGLVTAFAAIFAIIGLVFLAVKLRRGG